MLRVRTLSQLTAGQDWRLNLAHDREVHMLLWLTRGQGLLMLDGQRRGLGPHNAVFVPAGSLFALDLGRQSIGQAVLIPAATPLRFPQIPCHLRIRDAQVQSELTSFIEAAQREEQQDRPLAQDAMEAHVALMSVWLRREAAKEEHVPQPRNAGERLSSRFAEQVSLQYASGRTMGQYAKDLGVTPTHLTRAVKAATGRTAADILTERILYAARSLLEMTPHPAQNIARHLGFGSAAYFTRFIQQHTGHPPSILRRNARALQQTSSNQPPA
ncbi:AraC family transcriptional regulator [Sulfitobacter sp. S190]|nr:AraC family transcriptional regulator [Sulfitobacter sp. S190]